MSSYNFERRLFLAVDGPSGIKQSQKVSEENKKTLLEFATYIKATGKGLSRQVKLLLTLKRLAELLGAIPFKKATKNDLISSVAKVGGSDYTRSDF